ncbi:MAG: 1-acyl-sn-glycerol-3-phosphate acyltransferase [Magnetococcales bacterium]|nr:1-acyl-sn-glycerol-3-phosphate acyltransferase [Magnetococcales bacterium]
MSPFMQVKVWLGSALFFALFVAGILGFGLWITLVWPVTTLGFRHELARFWFHYNRRILALTCHLTDRVEGLERLPPGPVVILSKHQSAWETVVLQTLLPPSVLVLKESLMWIPVFGWALKATGQIPIDRSKGVEALHRMQERGLHHLGRGMSILIFPEGTRSAPGRPGKYNPGGVALALAAGVPIVPVAHNAGSFWPRRVFLKRPGEIQVRIGDPIPTAGLGRSDRKRIQALVEETIEGMMREIEPPVFP